jgi:hypothetical protein
VRWCWVLNWWHDSFLIVENNLKTFSLKRHHKVLKIIQQWESESVCVNDVDKDDFLDDKTLFVDLESIKIIRQIDIILTVYIQWQQFWVLIILMKCEFKDQDCSIFNRNCYQELSCSTLNRNCYQELSDWSWCEDFFQLISELYFCNHERSRTRS